MRLGVDMINIDKKVLESNALQGLAVITQAKMRLI